MSTTNDSTAPYPPSSVEAQCFYYGLPSRPRLIARSSSYVWVEPQGLEAYLTPKELSPLGFGHPLKNVWEDKVGPEMISYLDDMGVKWSSLDPLRIGYAGDPSPPPILWIGVLPGTLTHEVGVNVAIHCKNILSANGIDDVHVELRESEVFRCAKLYKPVLSFSSTVRAIEPFSTAVGLPISTEARPTVGGTGGFFISDPRYPGELFLVTARHVVICDDNKLIKYTDDSQPRQNHLSAIKSEINGHEILIEQLKRWLKAADHLEPEYAEAETDEANNAIKDLRAFLPGATRDWKDRKDRVIGHVSLGFTEDWAVVKVDASKIDSTNFVGNVIDLGIDIPVAKYSSWMNPDPANPPSFKYPGNRLHKFSGFIPDEEMWKPNSKTRDHNNDPIIMAMKRGHATGLTVGQLNTIRSITRYHSEGEVGMNSKESGPFSEPGDSGSSVVDGKGRIAGLLTGGAGDSDVSDCSYVTSINFLCERMAKHGLEANFFPKFHRN
ncbi:hypothetical protein F5887DRAFT_1273561, partial [Amanita rubescens]